MQTLGEKGGNLPGSIGRYIQYAKVVTQTRARIKSAMTYPTILIVFSFILMGILVNFVLPQFAGFYKSFEAQMPQITRMMMNAFVVKSKRWSTWSSPWSSSSWGSWWRPCFFRCTYRSSTSSGSPSERPGRQGT